MTSKNPKNKFSENPLSDRDNDVEEGSDIFGLILVVVVVAFTVGCLIVGLLATIKA